MKKVFTADQISDWFMLRPTFANINLTEEGKVESSPAETSSPEVRGDSSPTAVCKGQGAHAGGPPPHPAPPPPLASYEYPNLPITKNRQELISLIENNSVVIVRGATGSGKTSQLPQYILDHYNEKNASCNIVVTQPRKIGASSIARWVAAQRKCTLGSLVGYQVGLEKMATEHTRLTFMTTGVLLQKLVSAKCLTEFSHIFVDEVHERTEEMDFLLLVVRKFLHSNSRYVKIILMSATINCRQFAEYFGTPVRGKMTPAYMFEVEGAPYAIEEFYLDDLQSLFPNTVEWGHADDPHISPNMYDLAISLIQSFDEVEAGDHSRSEQDSVGVTSDRGSVLVFLPGLHEISFMQESLSKLAQKRLQVYPLHSTVTLEEQHGVFLSPIPGYRKVILSTNIAESSVTVPDVKYVIDFCLTRRLVCDQDTNYRSLRLTWTSKTNCNQRRGRAGRVSKGYCYRLVTRAFWKNDLPDHMIPEMLLAPLSSIMLKVKLLDMGDPRSVLSKALSPPNLSNIVRTVLQLKEVGALSVRGDGCDREEDGKLTFLGRVLAHLPVDLYLGKMIVLGHAFGCLDESLIIAASHSLKNFFACPWMQQLASHRSKLAFAQGTLSDSIAFVNAFKVWYCLKKKGELRLKKEQEWGKENFIQIKRIREVAELYEDLRRRVQQFNMNVEENPPPSDYTRLHTQRFILQVVIAGAHYPKYFLQGELNEDLASRELSGWNPRTTVMVRNLPPYSFLYYKQLQSLFRLCGQVKSISLDSSRAYVEFYRTSQTSAVLPEVSLALLLAQQGSSMELSVYPTEHIEQLAGNSQILHMKYARINVDLQNQTVSPVGLGSSTINPDRIPPDQLFVVNITEVVDVGHFWGVPADEASLEKQQRLTEVINQHTLLPLTVSVYPNLLCLAPYPELSEHSLYYRASILHVRGNTVEVFFLDYGNTAVVACSCLRELPSDLLLDPFQAYEFQVAGMRPSACSIIRGGQWSSHARQRFTALVKGSSHLVSLYSILHGVMRVQLLISSDTDSTSVVNILVEEGHAVEVEESFDSKLNHESLMSLYKDVETGSYVPSSASGVWKDRHREDKELINSLLASFSRNRHFYSKTRVHLHGPFSPHKVHFRSLSHQVHHHRTVTVERSSINSLTLNENPHYKHKRMLVAGNVCVNHTGTRILLSDTSFMPDIPGLPAAITMLFTPLMELRTNEERTCYTGALCGLGWNRRTQAGVLPDHDIELAFDVKFDVEDITEVNGLRVAINRLVCEGPRGILHLTSDQISRLQEDCRQRLVRLFTKSPPREAVTPLLYEKPGTWNQVDQSLKIDIAEPRAAESRAVVYQLHPITLLST